MKEKSNSDKILKEQPGVKIVLNGGKFELDDATIPFQIALSKKIMLENPTHVMVIDVTRPIYDKNGNKRDNDCSSERTIFKLEPVHYLQLHKPGIHHLIFVLFSGFENNDRKYFLEKSRGNYYNDIWYSSIENNTSGYCYDVEGRQVGYFEAIVDVPQEFFATKPESGFEKIVYDWTNSW